MAKAKKSWTEKLAKGEVEVVTVPRDYGAFKAGQTMLISTPRDIDALIRQIPKGMSFDIPELRVRLAKSAGTEVTCPLTTGIFLRIVAEAANEAFEKGTPPSELTPVWRVIGRKTSTAKKLSFDPTWLFDQRAREGIDAQ